MMVIAFGLDFSSLQNLFIYCHFVASTGMIVIAFGLDFSSLQSLCIYCHFVASKFV